jgi:hypothetical protein
MSWQITGTQKFPAVIGEPFGGGFFAGYISHTADGSPTHALIVAPAETGASGTGYTLTANLQWKTADTTTSNTASQFDGVANTAAMVTAGITDHPAAQFCVNLSIGGFTDWYLPAIAELDIAYFNLKPSTANNNTAAGINAYSVPKRNTAYTVAYPTQTKITAFNTSAQAFAASPHWVSDQFSSTQTYFINMSNGQLSANPKTGTFRVRAFRRIAL